MSKKFQLILLACVFAVPVLIATALQTPWLHYEPEQTKNYGKVFSPSPALQSWLPADPAAATQSGRWTLLFRAQGACGEECLAQVDLCLRVWQAQGTERERLRLLFVAEDPAPLPELDQHWQGAAVSAHAELPAQARVILVDPEGYAATWYPDGFDGSGLRKDVRHLLKWSKGGR